MKRVFIKTVLATVALAAMGLAQAQEKTIKFANQNSAGHPIVMGMEKFKEVVEAKSGGKIKVNLFLGGALGSDQANVSALQGGTLEMVAMNSGILASQVKDFGVFDFPFMFADGKEADAVVTHWKFRRTCRSTLQEAPPASDGFVKLTWIVGAESCVPNHPTFVPFAAQVPTMAISSSPRRIRSTQR